MRGMTLRAVLLRQCIQWTPDQPSGYLSLASMFPTYALEKDGGMRPHPGGRILTAFHSETSDGNQLQSFLPYMMPRY